MIIYHEIRKKGRIRPIKLVEEISQILGKVAFNAITLPPILTIMLFLLYTHIVLVIA
jgi:hypothetical protein